jgi:hypothetical protein
VGRGGSNAATRSAGAAVQRLGARLLGAGLMVLSSARLEPPGFEALPTDGIEATSTATGAESVRQVRSKLWGAGIRGTKRSFALGVREQADS